MLEQEGIFMSNAFFFLFFLSRTMTTVFDESNARGGEEGGESGRCREVTGDAATYCM